MPQIDFYLVQDASMVHVACKLLEKVYQQKMTAHAHCENETLATQANEMLWTFKDASFIPHELVSEINDHEPPISIGFGEQMPPAIYDVLLTLSAELPEFATQFERILFIIPTSNEAWKQVARDYYKDFKAQGWQVNHHTI